jgi:hypothetical protein
MKVEKKKKNQNPSIFLATYLEIVKKHHFFQVEFW